MQLANRLLDNRTDAPVLECLAGARFRVLAPVQVALSGFGHAHAWLAQPGEIVEITAAAPGVWSYLALPGGVDAPRWLESTSVCLRAGIGSALAKNANIACVSDPLGAWRAGIVRRYPDISLADTGSPLHDDPLAVGALPIRLWPGPQWAQFSAQAKKSLCAQAWQVSRQSDRSGYRLEGEALAVPDRELFSEPVRIGTLQVPPDGQPIVCLNDGPTVGGYPKIAVIDPLCLRLLVQTRPGSTVRFTLAS